MLRLILFLFLFLPFSLQAGQVAVVINSKAIIYADIDLKSPIGFVRKGKKLAVGEVKRRKGTVLPVLVNGRVAWIRTTDITLPNERKSFTTSRKVSEHEIVIDEDVRDPLDQNNFLSLRTGPVSGGTLTGTVGGQDIEAEIESATETSLMFEHKNPYLFTHWGLGLDYFTATAGLFTLRTMNLKGGLSWVPIRLSWISTEIYANIVLSGDFRVESTNVGTYKGNMYGADYGVTARFLPEYTFGILAGFGMSYYRFSGLSEIENDENELLTSFSTFQAAKAFVGISYKF